MWFSLFSLLPLVVVASPVLERDFIDQITHLLTEIDVTISLDSFTSNNVSVAIAVQNPLILPLRVNSITATASLNGTDLATIKHTFSNFVTPALSKGNSGVITQVPLTQGLDASLAFVPAGILDIKSIINLDIGILPVPIFPYSQASVPTVYTIAV